MNDLSPAAQAVLDAYFTHADLLNREVSHEEMLAAAIRAAVMTCSYQDSFYGLCVNPNDLLTIATELKGTNDPA